jgi:hypothetical protein
LKICALILAYQHPRGAAALTDYFIRQLGYDVIVHVDIKADASLFVSACHPATKFFGDRENLCWRGFSMVRATVHLLAAAADYDHVIILSDDTLPLVPAAQFLSRFLVTSDWIFGVRRDEPASRRRYERFYMFDAPATQLRWQPLADRHFTAADFAWMHRLEALIKRGKLPLEVYYQGAQWMALSKRSVAKVLASWREDIWRRDSFEFAEVPDESYIHNILVPTMPEGWTSRILTYTDWRSHPKPMVFTSIEQIMPVYERKLSELFIRKIDTVALDPMAWLAFLERQQAR